MLSKTNRLRGKKDFEEVFKTGDTYRSAFLTLRVLKNSSGPVRFGFVVSTKVSKSAVVRNKIKRRLSESVRSLLLKKKTGADVAVIALPSAEKKGFSEINEAVESLFKKARLI